MPARKPTFRAKCMVIVAIATCLPLLAGCQCFSQPGYKNCDPVPAPWTGKGCHSGSGGFKDPPPPPLEMPRELTKISLPDYVIEPPDVLLIDAVRVVPRPPYRISSLDVLSIHVEGALPDRPLTGQIQVEPGGTINLGPPYGTINVNDMTLEQATAAITRQLQVTLREPVVTLLLEQTTGKQQIAGEHLVGPDGTVTLGTYGKVYVAGLTQMQAKAAIEMHLSSMLERPEVAVDIAGYNSKVYYVIMQGAGLGDGVARFPITGNETVLDAISQVNGLEAVSSKHLWVARPAPYGACDQVLPVDWNAITQRADTATNYQLLPGDRLFIREDKLVATNTMIAKVLDPAERLFGFALLGGSTVKFYRFFHRFQGGGGGGF